MHKGYILTWLVVLDYLYAYTRKKPNQIYSKDQDTRGVKSKPLRKRV